MSFPSTLTRVVLLPFWPLRLVSAMWRYPKTAAGLAVLLILAGGGAVHLWAISEERAARLALTEEHYTDARRHTDHCLLVWRRSASTHLLAARVARLQFDFPRAEAHLRASTELAGGATAGTQLEWLLLRAQGGEVDEVAPGLFRLVEEKDPESPAILETLSGIYIRQLRLQMAMGCLNVWLEREPDAVIALDRRGWTFDRLEATDAARTDWERVLELAPERGETRLRLAELFLDHQDPNGAQPLLERLQKSGVDRPEVTVALGRCHFLHGDMNAATAAFDQAVAAAPDNPKALLWRGKVEYATGQDAEAETWLRRALEKDPTFLEAHMALLDSLRHQPDRKADAAAEQRRYNLLKTSVERLTMLLSGSRSKSPETADKCAEVGSLFLCLDRKELAMDWLHRALKLDDKCKPAHEALATYYEQAGETEAASRHRRLADGQEQ